MPTTLLVLGGSGFVGRAVVREGLDRGWEVTTFNRGHAASTPPQIRPVVGDRLDRCTLEPLRSRDWDVVVDTWSGAPRAVRDSAAVLADHAACYVYISSESVYAPPLPLGVQETAPTVTASPDAEAGSYPELKRGAELAVTRSFGDRGLLARAGLILGPHEDVGRLTWCVVSRRGHATIGSLLESCRAVAGRSDTQLTWVDPAAITAAGIEAWTELPIWLPPDSPSAGMHAANVERAYAAGLRCRPVRETVQDTWQWLAARNGDAPLGADLDPPGLDRARERAALGAWHARAPTLETSG